MSENISPEARLEADRAAHHLILGLKGDQNAMALFRAGKVLFTSPLEFDGTTLLVICATQGTVSTIWEANNARLASA